LPDFGVPYYRPGAPAPGNQYSSTAGGPYTDFGVNRNTFYGLVNRDYYSITDYYLNSIGDANTLPSKEMHDSNALRPISGKRINRKFELRS